MSIALTMICRNSAATIRKAVLSALPLVHEAIIVDTGSTDDTLKELKAIKLAATKPVHILREKWVDSFSVPRNKALEFARSRGIDFAFVLDADEEFICDPAFILELRLKICKRDSYPFEGYILEVVNENEHQFTENQEGTLTSCRFFPVHENVGYRYRVHNWLCRLDNGAPILRFFSLPESIYIRHSGYTTAEIKAKKKHERTLRLLRKQLEETPDNSLMLTYLAREHFLYGEIDEFKEATKKAIASLKTEPHKPIAANCKRMLHIMLSEQKKAEAAAKESA